MQKYFDNTKTYAIALGGGGAKGGYEVGVWRSLNEEGLKYNAVSGTSVGALNGALMAMRDLNAAQLLWSEIKYSKVMDVDDEYMGRVYSRDIRTSEIRPLLRRIVNVVRDGGFDVTPLRGLIRNNVDPGKIRNSDVAFYAMTYSLTDKKPVEVDMRAIPEDEICDMLLASAYFPAFKNEPLLDGKRFTDGGVFDSLPVMSLFEHGYKDVIAVRLSGGLNLGRERHVHVPDGATLSYIEPTRRLGSTLNFSQEQSRYNIRLGYFDAKRFVYGLAGRYYYIDRTMTERDAYEVLCDMVRSHIDLVGAEEISLRELHESVMPRLAKEYNAAGDYYDVLVKYLETTGERLGIPEFRIVTDRQLIDEVASAVSKSPDVDTVPRAFSRLG